jgi:hypothetical protein
MLLEDGGAMSAAELAAMQAELEAFKVRDVHTNASSDFRQTPIDMQPG